MGLALTTLRSQIETKFEFQFKPTGEKPKTLTNESDLNAYRYSPKATHRKASYKALFKKYKEHLNTFFTIYQGVVKDWDHMAKLRGHPTPISMRNHANDIPDEAISTLLTVCKENTGVFHEYFKFKAKELKKRKLRRYDIYAPLDKTEQKIQYEEGLKMVLETMDQLTPRFGDKARQVIAEQHIDVYPSKSKAPGAFCATINPNITPYVLLNYTNKGRDVAVIAHELGHAIHSLYANEHSVSTQFPPLPIAETASTFAEMVIFEKLFEKAENDQVRKSMLSEKISDSYATIIRQSYFVDFEIKAHEAISKGVTAEELSDIYFGTLEEQFGNSVTLAPEFKYEWALIPHIVNTPFYCYAYNFGELLSMSLYAQYKEQGQSFIPKLEKILAYGGSENPQKILAEVGVDMGSKEFWQGSFEVVKNWQKQLESY